MRIPEIVAAAPQPAEPVEAPAAVDGANPALPIELAKAIRGVAAVVLAATLFAGQIMLVTGGTLVGISDYFLQQDVWWLTGLVVVYALYFWRQPVALCEPLARTLAVRPAATLRFLMALVFAIALAGTFLVHLNYGLSRDELMAGFDAEIFTRGRMLEALPNAWREFAVALVPQFTLSVADNAAWASTYLPGNAAFRALVGFALIPQVANPLLAALAVLAAWSVARALWPDRTDAALVAALLVATSSQMLFMAMTSYAMTGHLLMTLVWLRLFLRNDGWGHAGCLAVGLVACGWHQLAFHALFAAPFIAHLWWRRRWPVAILYTLGYGAVALLWINYGYFAAAASGVELRQAQSTGLSAYTKLVLSLTENFNLPGAVMMLFNGLRFVAWESPILLPLVVVGCSLVRTLPLVLRLAAAGLCLTLAVVIVIMPFQGHGWGYRYLHGYIGVLALIAAAAWVRLVPAKRAWESAFWTPLAAATALVALVQIPGQALQVRAMIEPRAAASAAIAGAAADIVVVDPRGLYFSEILIRNDSALRTKPLMMYLDGLQAPSIARLCDRAERVTIFDQSTPAAQGIRGNDVLTHERASVLLARAEKIKALPCYVAIGSR